MIWNKSYDLKSINEFHKNTMQQFIGIEFIEIGDDYIKAKMPVNEKTKQPHGLLHGGASVVLAESLGSLGSVLCLDPDKKTCVGLEINTNHIRAVREGFVYGITKPIHLGKTTHIWEIKIHDEQNRLTSVSRITNYVIEKKAEKGV